MGKAKYIYFNDEIIEKLEKVENMSALINKLLHEHFKYGENKTKEDLLSIKTKLEEEAKTKIEIIKKETEKIESQINKIELTEEEQKIEQESKANKFADRITYVLNNFKTLFNLDLTAEEAGEYLENFDNGLITLQEFRDIIEQRRDDNNKETITEQ